MGDLLQQMAETAVTIKTVTGKPNQIILTNEGDHLSQVVINLMVQEAEL